MLVYRFSYELDDVSDKFFKEIKQLFFPDIDMASEPRSKGLYQELFINNKPCGYAVSLNTAGTLRKLSHLFADTTRMLFDEFQSETNQYCPKEINKFNSLHTTVARGGGKSIRYVPVIMVSNPVSLLNPYYIAMNICNKVPSEGFYRGNGFVMECGFNADVAKERNETGFAKAFSNSDYNKYDQGAYLNDNEMFVFSGVKPKGKYTLSLKYNNKFFSVYRDQNTAYCVQGVDKNFPLRYAVTTSDQDERYITFDVYKPTLIKILRDFVDTSNVKCSDLLAKEALFEFIMRG